MPRIGITCSIDTLQRASGRIDRRLRLNLWYVDAVLASGALPVPLAATEDLDLIGAQLQSLDGLLITGGPDVPPDRYGQDAHPKTSPLCARRTAYDFALFHKADKMGLPILGICLGCQIINVARGGTLFQHLDDVSRQPAIIHTDGVDYPRHAIRTQEGSLLRRIIPREIVEANSSHHQAVEQLGTGLVATAWAPDGVIEAVEDPTRRFLLGVQWHPEVIANEEDHAALFRALTSVARCKNVRI